jgi:hypothetical protein
LRVEGEGELGRRKDKGEEREKAKEK